MTFLLHKTIRLSLLERKYRAVQCTVHYVLCTDSVFLL